MSRHHILHVERDLRSHQITTGLRIDARQAQKSFRIKHFSDRAMRGPGQDQGIAWNHSGVHLKHGAAQATNAKLADPNSAAYFTRNLGEKPFRLCAVPMKLAVSEKGDRKHSATRGYRKERGRERGKQKRR